MREPHCLALMRDDSPAAAFAYPRKMPKYDPHRATNLSAHETTRPSPIRPIGFCDLKLNTNSSRRR